MADEISLDSRQRLEYTFRDPRRRSGYLCRNSREGCVSVTWLPITPRAQAVDTWLGPNHTAASWAGTPSMNTCDVPTSAWPRNANQKRSGVTDITFSQAPATMTAAPDSTVSRRPCKHDSMVADVLLVCHTLRISVIYCFSTATATNTSLNFYKD